jgi:hypothetical protein
MKKLFVLLTAAALAVAFTVPAMAAEWNLYGSSRVWTGWLDVSKEKAGLGGEVDDADLVWEQQSNSRWGATAKAGAIGGAVEYGTGVNLRKLYGTWNFGAGTFLVGQDYTPIDTFWSSQCGPTGGDVCGINYGAPYSSRLDQAKLIISDFEVALIEVGSPAAPATVAGATDVDDSIPRLEASYMGKFGPVTLKPYLGYQTYDEVIIAGTTETEKSIDSHILGIFLKGNFGPFEAAFNIYTAQNPGNYGLSQDIVLKSAAWNAATSDVEDCDSMGTILILKFKVSDMIKLEAGWGRVANERDVGTTTTEEETNAYYIQANISPAKGFYIVPEIGKIDYGDRQVTGVADQKLGDKTYYGAKWQINF